MKHFVTIKDIQMQTIQVTQKTWLKIMGENPSHFKGDDLPVESVSWNDVQIFLAKLNELSKKWDYRLPTEQEWENAAQSCDSQSIMDIAWCYENSNNQTRPIGSKLPNKLGLYDMLGNVWEWTSTMNGSGRVLRGGGWYNGARYLRSGVRVSWWPDDRDSVVGFRLVRIARNPRLSNTLTLGPSARALAVAREALEKIADILSDKIIVAPKAIGGE